MKTNFSLLGGRSSWRTAVLAASLMVGTALWGAETAAPPVALPKGSPTQSNSSNYSYAITEVLKMVDAKVSPAVIKDFIQVSVSPFQATASDIIALKERGVSEGLIQSMLQRDAALQALAANPPPTQQRAELAAPVPLTQPAPTVAVPQYAPSTVYYEAQPLSTYTPTAYYYNYPSYYPYYAYGSWGWPWYSYSPYRHPFYYGGFHGGSYVHGGYVSGYHPGGGWGHSGGGWGHGPSPGGSHGGGGHPGGRPGGFGGGHGGGGGHRGR